MRWLSRIISISVGIGALVVLYFLLRARVPDQNVGEGFLTYAKFRDGSHLAPGSPVVIAGVRIGDITRLSIEGQFARVDMNLQKNIQIPVDAFVTRRADSLFGDSYIEVIFSGGAEGAAPERLLRSGEPITHVIEGSSTDAVLRSIDRSLPRVDNALEVVHEAVGKARKVVNGDTVEGISGADSWLAGGKIEGPLTKTRTALEHIDEITTKGAEALADTAPAVVKTIQRVDTAVVRARDGLRDAKTQLVTALRDTRAGLDGADPQIEQVAQVVTAINQGSGADWKGTLGRLVNDPGIGDQLESISQDAADAGAFFIRFKSYFGVRLEYNVFGQAVRFYATAEIAPKPDKFYLLEIESSTLGSAPTDQLADDPTTPYIRRQGIADGLRYTAQFGKRLGIFRFRGGLKDSTFGAGADVLMMKGRLRFSTDVFGSFDYTPRLKLTAAYAMFRSIYIVGGIDDALNSPGYLPIRPDNTPVPQALQEIRHGRDYFLGASIYLDESDLSTLIRLYGALLIATLAR